MNYFFSLITVLLSSTFLFGQKNTVVSYKKTDSLQLFFATGKHQITDSTPLLSKLKGLNNQFVGKIVVCAYTDSIGSLVSNKKLATKRLLSTLQLIERSHIDSVFIDTINNNEMEHQLNLQNMRRVDVFFYKELMPVAKKQAIKKAAQPNQKVETPVKQSKLSIENMSTEVVLNEPINLHINFQPGTAIFMNSSYNNLKRLHEIASKNPQLNLELNGHVCCQNDYELSIKRAETVKTYLIQKGIAAERISTTGLSNSQPLVPEYYEENKAKNRRVEVVFKN